MNMSLDGVMKLTKPMKKAQAAAPPAMKTSMKKMGSPGTTLSAKRKLAQKVVQRGQRKGKGKGKGKADVRDVLKSNMKSRRGKIVPAKKGANNKGGNKGGKNWDSKGKGKNSGKVPVVRQNSSSSWYTGGKKGSGKGGKPSEKQGGGSYGKGGQSWGSSGSWNNNNSWDKDNSWDNWGGNNQSWKNWGNESKKGNDDRDFLRDSYSNKQYANRSHLPNNITRYKGSGKMIQIANCPSNLNKDELKGAFADVGDVTHVEIDKHAQLAWLVFNQSRDAYEAEHQFDGGEINGSTIKITIV